MSTSNITNDTIFFKNTNQVENVKNQPVDIGRAYSNSIASSVGLDLEWSDNSDTPTYWTLPASSLSRIKYVKFTDFRSRRQFLDRRQDGANAALNGVKTALTYKNADFVKRSLKSAKYYASNAAPGGTYSIINLNSPGPLGYGWGNHSTPPIIKDFTLQTNVTTTWAFNSPTPRWRPNVLARAFPFRGDKVSVVDFGKRDLDSVYQWKPKLFNSAAGKFGQKLLKGANFLGSVINNTNDFIKFYFTGPKLHNGSEEIDDIIVFRAILTTLEDSFSASWDESRMIGRADPNYYYTGFGRSLQLGFTVYATSRDEVKPIWRKLNALAGYTAPIYGKNTIAPTAPWMRMTVGDLFIQQPILVDSVSYSLQDADTQWEINVEEDPQMKQVPIKISVTMGLKLITDYLPENGGQFYTLSDRNDEFGSFTGNDNWLSDSESAKRRSAIGAPNIIREFLTKSKTPRKF